MSATQATIDLDDTEGLLAADRDGLCFIPWLPPAPATLPDPSFGKNFLGLGIAFWPLFADGAAAVVGAIA